MILAFSQQHELAGDEDLLARIFQAMLSHAHKVVRAQLAGRTYALQVIADPVKETRRRAFSIVTDPLLVHVLREDGADIRDESIAQVIADQWESYLGD